MLDQFLKTIARHNMLPHAARVGVAVSGGADSVALLHALLRLAKPRQWSVEVLHADHMLRGAESDGDREFVEALAAKLNVPCWTTRADARLAGGNLEQAAREQRYAFFERIRSERQFDAVATGHTASDQAETVLMRLLRGASADSLAGIRPVNRGWIVRPLLEIPRERVRAWLAEKGERWREDSSNRDTVYDRNRIRQQLLPLLRAEWNPEVDLALARLASGFARDEDYWVDAVGSAFASCCQRNAYGVVVDLDALAGYAPAIRFRLLKRACGEAATHPPRLEQAHLDELAALAAKPEGDGRLSLPGLQAWRSFKRLLIHPAERTPRRPPDVKLEVPGTAVWAEGGSLIAARRARFDGAFYNEFSSLLDGATIAGPLLLRAWSGGDVFQETGRTGAVTLHSLFQKHSISAWERVSWPVLEWRGQIVWTRRFGAAAGWQAKAGSESAVKIDEEQPAGQE